LAQPSFIPPEEIEIFCRYCKKNTIAQLSRSIADSGRTIDRNATFEYTCTKCNKTFCFSGQDLIAKEAFEDDATDTREYAPTEKYYIGETIFHKKFNEEGRVVNKDLGDPQRLLVSFKSAGLIKLVEGIGA